MTDRIKTLRQMIMDDPSAILLLRASVVNDDLWKLALEQDPGLYKYCENPSEEISIFAVELDGSNLKHAVENRNMNLSKRLIFSALENYPPAIFDIPKNIITSEMMEYAFDHDPTLIQYFDNVRRSYLDKKIKNDPTFIRFLNNPSEDQVYEAIEYDPNFCAYVKEFTPRIKELIQVLYPDIIPMIPGLSEKIQEL